MADNKRWFKVWNSILTDPSFLITPLDNIGRWVLLGALISLHGKNGQLEIEEASFRQILRIENDNSYDNKLPPKNIILRRGENDNGKIIVIMKNWHKYQKDSTGYKRLKEYRQRQNDNGLRGDKEETKKRKEKEKNKRLKDVLLENEQTFREAYPAINLEIETAKAQAWLDSNPKNKKSNLKRFLNNWFNTAQDRINRFPSKEDKFL